MERINVVCVTDDNLALQAAVLATSIAQHASASRPVDLHLLQYGDVTVDFEDVARCLSSDAFRMLNRRIKSPFSPEMTVASERPSYYIRLALPELMPRLNRIIYLDADTLVRSGLSELFDIDLEGSLFAAAIDPIISKARRQPPKAEAINTSSVILRRYAEDIVGNSNIAYINSGVMVVDLEHWRSSGFHRECLDFIQTRPYVLFADQDAINFAHRGRIKIIDERWNKLQAGQSSTDSASQILHFAGFKPWKPEDQAQPSDVVYWNYAMGTPYGEKLLEKFRGKIAWHIAHFQQAAEKIPPQFRRARREKADRTRSPEEKKIVTVAASPLVTILVTNFNYKEYLRECLEFVFAQTYANIQCIVVDDASTDGSQPLIKEVTSANVRTTEILAIFRDDNGGQSAAILEGLKDCTGEFVVFLDADDYLLPTFIEDHVRVHLSLRVPVGFTCSNMFQIQGSALMSATSFNFGQYVTDHLDRKMGAAGISVAGLTPSDEFNKIADRLYLVPPEHSGWPWSATSGMMFRRDAISIWDRAPGLAQLRYQSDAFFCYGVNAVSGSVLIDEPLSVYRIHGENGFASRVPLNRVRTFDYRMQGHRAIDALKLLHRFAVKERSYFMTIVWSRNDYSKMVSLFRTRIAEMRSLDPDRQDFGSRILRVVSSAVASLKPI